MNRERHELASVTDPPFDGSEPCIACPIEVRDVLACAHNLLGAMDGGDAFQIAKKRTDLKLSVARLERIAAAHFATSMHSHGRVPRPAEPSDA